MKTLLTLLLCLAVGLLVAATAGAGGPALAISASPFSLHLQGAATGAIHVTNPGSQTVAVVVSTGDLAVSAAGAVSVDPKRKPQRSARSWLSVAPGRLELAPGSSADVTVVAHPPGGAAPGDHYALVLLTSVPPHGVQVGVSTRIGVSVVDTVAGGNSAPPSIHAPKVIAKGKKRMLRLQIANRGDVLQRFARGQISVEVKRGARRVARLVGPGRVLLPHSTGLITLPYPKKLHGRRYVLVVHAGRTSTHFHTRL
jgi:P pilus assembly chaperone PapD